MQQQLRIKVPDVKPRATQEIPDMINLIKKIEANGFTYKAEGSVWFDTAKMPRYKEIFRRKKSAGDTEDTEDQSFTQSDYADNKRNVEDFVIWKGEKPGEPAWDSPWGRGRPGWHLECSTMSMKYLGETIDIHGGGKDLKSPHHQNEIAQSESATGKPFCKYWLHNGFLNINNEKMSKSLGNFITAREAMQKVPGVLIRYYFLTTYYQRPVDFSADKIDQALISLKRLQKTYDQILELKQDSKAKMKSELTTQIDAFITEFFASMDEDFNTAKAMGQLFGLINYLQKEILGPSIAVPSSFKKKLVKFFTDIDQFLDIFHEDKTEIEGDSVWKQKTTSLIEALLRLRQDLRDEKNYATSDRIRDLLKGLGVIINDSKAGTSWEWP